jgi:glycosyltransferase involved in cell wall biosynthesis
MERPDVILLHQSRHPLNRPRYYPNFPCVFDADDADILDPKCRDDVIECCVDSVSVVAGSRFLANEFRQYNPRVSVVWTGTYLQPSRRMVPSQLRLPSVAWATTDPVGYSYEAEFVREVIVRLAQRMHFTYLLYGVRADQRDTVEKFLVPIRRAGVPVKIFQPMVYKQFVRSLESVAVGLQPVSIENPFSRGKSFGKLLAYMTADVAIVASHAVDHPLFFRDGVNGVLAPNDIDRWVEGTALLLQDPSRRSRMVDNARAGFRTRLTTVVAAKLVSEVLLDAIANRPAPSQFEAHSQVY